MQSRFAEDETRGTLQIPRLNKVKRVLPEVEYKSQRSIMDQFCERKYEPGWRLYI